MPLTAIERAAAHRAGASSSMATRRDNSLPNEIRILDSKLPRVTAAVTVEDVAYWVYVGQVDQPYTAKFVEFYMTVAGTGAQTAAEVALASSPSAPNKAAQVLTVLAASGTVDDLTATAAVKRNTTAFGTTGYVVPQGTHLWAALRTLMATNEPTVSGLTQDMAQGRILTTTTAGALAAGSTYTGAIVTASPTAWGAPDLRVTAD